jgi:hypothetical protein
LKALLRKAAERTIPDLCRRIGKLVAAFSASECKNYFTHAVFGRDASSGFGVAVQEIMFLGVTNIDYLRFTFALHIFQTDDFRRYKILSASRTGGWYHRKHKQNKSHKMLFRTPATLTAPVFR